MLGRSEAEALFRAIVGGVTPKVGDVVEFTEKGWRLSRSHFRGIVTADPDDAQVGDFWFNSTDSKMRVRTGSGIYESAAFTVVP